MTEIEFNEKLQKAKVEFEKLLKEINNSAKPLANYVASKKSGNNLYISGQLPKDLLNKGKVITGNLNDNNDIFEAKYAAAMSAMQILLILKQELGDLSKIKSCIQLNVFVNSTASFTNQHLVANGASDLICDYLPKEIAQHSRCAVGVVSLPLGAIVEVGAVFERNNFT